MKVFGGFMISYRKFIAILFLSFLVQSQAQAWWNPFSSNSPQSSPYVDIQNQSTFLGNVGDLIRRNPGKTALAVAALFGCAYGLYAYFARNPVEEIEAEGVLPMTHQVGDAAGLSNTFFRVRWSLGREISLRNGQTDLHISRRSMPTDMLNLDVNKDDDRTLWIELLRIIKHFELRLKGDPKYKFAITARGTEFLAHNLLRNEEVAVSAISSSSSSSSSQRDEGLAECAFCNPTTEIVYQDDVVQVIKKKWSARDPYKTELLIIPTKHIQDIVELDVDNDYHQNVWVGMLRAINDLKRRLDGDKQFTLEINGPGFNRVQHLHMHFKSQNNLQPFSIAEGGGASSSSASSSGASSSSASSGVQDDTAKITCTQCGAEDNLKKCSQCQTTQYCSKECQNADWPKHKRVCNKLKEAKKNKALEQSSLSPKAKAALMILSQNIADLHVKDLSPTLVEFVFENMTFRAYVGAKNSTLAYVLSFVGKDDVWRRCIVFDTIDGAIKFVNDAFGDVFPAKVIYSLRKCYRDTTSDLHKEISTQMRSQSLNACAKCHKPASNRCSGCKKVYYCSGDCQHADWQKHKGACQQ